MPPRPARSIFPDEIFVVVSLLTLIATCAWVWLAGENNFEVEIITCRVSGYGSLGYLAIAILLGPLLRVVGWIGLSFDWTTSARISKNTGIASAIVALVHSTIAIAGYLQWNWREVFDYSYLYAGLLALAVLVLLLIFSFKPLMSCVGWQLWKPTFRLSFAAAMLVLCHLLYAPFASLHWTLGLYGGATALFFLRFLPDRRTPAATASGSLDTALDADTMSSGS